MMGLAGTARSRPRGRILLELPLETGSRKLPDKHPPLVPFLVNPYFLTLLGKMVMFIQLSWHNQIHNLLPVLRHMTMSMYYV